jgi:hypothetical protein
MRLPSPNQFRQFFKQVPWWVPWLIAILIFGRFAILALWKLAYATGGG